MRERKFELRGKVVQTGGCLWALSDRGRLVCLPPPATVLWRVLVRAAAAAVRQGAATRGPAELVSC